VKGEPIKESEESDLSIYKEFPTIIKEYYVSPMSSSGVRINLKVMLSPHVIYDWTSQGDKTATYSFYVIFRFEILNPEHKDANRFLDEYYHLYASHIVDISSYCIASAVRKLRKSQNKGGPSEI
jgi:hypothetical protein